MPEAEDGRVGFVAIDNDLELGFKETVYGRDDDVEGEDNEVIFLSSPLKVVLRADLNGGGVSKGCGYDGFIVRNVKQLCGGEAFVLKSP